MWPENAKGNSVFAFRRGQSGNRKLAQMYRSRSQPFRDSEKQERGEKVIFQLVKTVTFT